MTIPAPEEERLFIALDIDGTVLLEDGSYSPGVEEAVAEAAERGHLVTLATGRSWESTHPVMTHLGILPPYVVCANGATIMSRDPDDPTGYIRHTIETFDATEALRFIREHLPGANYMVELADGTRLFTEYMDDWDLNRPGARHVAFDEMLGLQVTRVVVVSPEHDGDEFNAFVERMGLQQVTYSVGWSAWLDIAPQGVNKATALEKVREWLEVDPSRVVAMGDGRNDIEMLTWAHEGGGRGIAMGQAPDEVQECATQLTLPVEGGGVAAALSELGAATSTIA
ncbi:MULTISPECIES: HAD family hydrolase [Microbacterium]|uniref:Haloacid dehalogenase n=1 Tax=Microbacterium barkeri TaxID=33917 RepID=A0A9W6LY03_9MICO|nr:MULTISPECIES: HAD-IIB family hydrolase [Microbacterium]MDI6944971.1 HAD-IIB family hydrolase [Microbacterium barkeri]MDR6878076.1 Cof subfamily protein (haloacid dehalogenase superfamily) [Microbacterium barkeri]WRH18491.1 HAD-IIB family hydrolase [Microbacterium sp. JZ37]GLJ62997.1 haloacid dehalogenase [Microbacterium barkeri]